MISAVLAGCASQSPAPGAAATLEPAQDASPTTGRAPLSVPDSRSTPVPPSGSVPTPGQVSDPAFDTRIELAANAGVELPPGPGRDLLVSACLGCHDLGGLTLFSSFYDREDWRTLVLTMIETGASIAPAEIEVIADYLGQHFGTGSL